MPGNGLVIVIAIRTTFFSAAARLSLDAADDGNSCCSCDSFPAVFLSCVDLARRCQAIAEAARLVLGSRGDFRAVVTLPSSQYDSSFWTTLHRSIDKSDY